MYSFNRDITDFKVGSKILVNGKEKTVTKNTGERIYFGKQFRNWLKLKNIGLYFE